MSNLKNSCPIESYYQDLPEISATTVVQDVRLAKDSVLWVWIADRVPDRRGLCWEWATELQTLNDITGFISMMVAKPVSSLWATKSRTELKSVKPFYLFTLLYQSEALSADEQRQMKFGPVLIAHPL